MSDQTWDVLSTDELITQRIDKYDREIAILTEHRFDSPSANRDYMDFVYRIQAIVDELRFILGESRDKL